MGTTTLLKKLIDDIREGDAHDGVVRLKPTLDERPWGLVDSLKVGLARFQSYRGRTEAALLDELEDFTHDKSMLQYTVDAERSIVLLRTW